LPRSESSQKVWLIAFLLSVALLARVGVLWTKQANLATDPDAYVEIARNLHEGHGFARGIPPHLTAFRPPLYPAVLATIFNLGGGTLAIGIMQLTLGVGTVF